MDKRALMFFLGALVAAYLIGRYGAPDSEKSKKELSTLTIENASLKKQLSETYEKQKATEKVETTVSKKLPDGTETVRTQTIFRRASATSKTKDETIESIIAKESATKSIETKEIQNRRGGVFSLHALMPLNNFSTSPVYGATMTVPILGPIHAGLDLFTDPRIGVSLGWGF